MAPGSAVGNSLLPTPSFGWTARSMVQPGEISAVSDALLFGGIRPVHEQRLIVEDHGLLQIGGKRFPSGHSAMIGIAGTCKLYPCLAHAGGEGPCFRATPRHGFASIGVVEYERQFGAMKGARAPVEHGSLPGEPVKIRRRLALGRFCRRLCNRSLAHGRHADARPEIEGRRFRRSIPEGPNDQRRLL